MGGSFSPRTDNPEFANSPTHEFNLWFDPEAAHTVLMAPWKRIACTSVDISVKTQLTPEMIDHIKDQRFADGAIYRQVLASASPNYNYLWDELAAAAWLDPSLITKKETRYLRCGSRSRGGLRRRGQLDRARQTEVRWPAE